ncbi:hypothetical protein [Lactobacillus intestinalis]|uniref:hypothetical protein n=1 Tax=Lactobacillus intestinalis TaxID=151781 RepID=UPI00242FEF6C|nr:hypothetical protein [Lactobacillus intestinalis]
MRKYIANIAPLNAEKIGTSAHGTAEFTIDGDTMHIKIEMFDTPANTEHWQHFHGFTDGKDAIVATMEQDTNHDGYIDLPETTPVSGTTMVPFDKAPQDMDIPNDTYPVADANGYYRYEKDVPMDILREDFKRDFGTDDIALDKRVVYVHGVPASMERPDTVKGDLLGYDTHVTLPIAGGKIEMIEND